MSKLENCKYDTNNRLHVYGLLKENFELEEYLLVKSTSRYHLTKFRFALHMLPIERLRYAKPQVKRENRICTLCNQCIGDEFHILMECDHHTLKDLRSKYVSLCYAKMPVMCNMTPRGKFVTLLKGNHELIEYSGQFIAEINALFS